MQSALSSIAGLTVIQGSELQVKHQPNATLSAEFLGNADYTPPATENSYPVITKLLHKENTHELDPPVLAADIEKLLSLSLSHPHILRIIGTCLQFNNEPSPALVLESFTGSIASCFQKTTAEKMKLLEQLSSALQFLHSHSPPIVHGDIRPASCLIATTTHTAPTTTHVSQSATTSSSSASSSSISDSASSSSSSAPPTSAFTSSSNSDIVVKLSNFISTVLIPADVENGINFLNYGSLLPPFPMREDFAGFHYHAPELSDDPPIKSTANDIYSFAVLAIQLLNNGNLPWSHLTEKQIIKKQAKGEIMDIPDVVPKELTGLLAKALESEPAERPTSAQLHTAIAEWRVTAQKQRADTNIRALQQLSGGMKSSHDELDFGLDMDQFTTEEEWCDAFWIVDTSGYWKGPISAASVSLTFKQGSITRTSSCHHSSFGVSVWKQIEDVDWKPFQLQDTLRSADSHSNASDQSK